MARRRGTPIGQSLSLETLDALQQMLPNEQRTHLTMDEAVRAIGVPERYIMGWIKMGFLPYTGPLEDPRIDRDQLLAAQKADERRKRKAAATGNSKRPRNDAGVPSHKSTSTKKKKSKSRTLHPDLRWIPIKNAATKIGAPQRFILNCIEKRLIPSRGATRADYRVRVRDLQTHELQRALLNFRAQDIEHGTPPVRSYKVATHDSEQLVVPAMLKRLEELDRKVSLSGQEQAEHSRLRSELRRIDRAIFDTYARRTGTYRMND